MNYTTEQKSQLKTWAEERDLILSEISKNKQKKEKLEKENLDLSESNTEINLKIAEATGKLSVLEDLDKKMREVVTVELCELKERKTELETKISSMVFDIDELEKNKNNLLKDIEGISSLYSDVYLKLNLIEKKIGESSELNTESIRVINELLDIIKTKSEQIISVSTQNIEKHNVILDKIPELFVELRRKSLEREEIKKTKHI